MSTGLNHRQVEFALEQGDMPEAIRLVHVAVLTVGTKVGDLARGLMLEIEPIKDGLQRVVQDVDSMKGDISKIEGSLDTIAKRHKRLDGEVKGLARESLTSEEDFGGPTGRLRALQAEDAEAIITRHRALEKALDQSEARRTESENEMRAMQRRIEARSERAEAFRMKLWMKIAVAAIGIATLAASYAFGHSDGQTRARKEHNEK